MPKRALWTAGRKVCDGEKRDKSLLYAVADAARQVGPAAAEQRGWRLRSVVGLCRGCRSHVHTVTGSHVRCSSVREDVE
jgi:hypothetical protein